MVRLRTKTCKQCGCEFALTTKGNRDYCSHSCHRAWTNARSSAKRKEKRPDTFTRNCKTCGREFTYQNRRGCHKLHCSEECNARSRMDRFKEQLKRFEFCKVDGCDKRVRSARSPYCEMHYGRQRRNGTNELLPSPGRYVTASGYVLVKAAGHPLAFRSGLSSEHRVVAYEMHSGRCPPCYWCGCSLEWTDAVVDHLNEMKDDNRPLNLAVACNNCNRARGAMEAFFRTLTDAGAFRFVEIMSSRLGVGTLTVAAEKTPRTSIHQLHAGCLTTNHPPGVSRFETACNA